MFFSPPQGKVVLWRPDKLVVSAWVLGFWQRTTRVVSYRFQVCFCLIDAVEVTCDPA